MKTAKEEVDSEPSTSGSTGENAEVLSNSASDLLTKYEILQTEFIDLKACLNRERALVNRFRIDYAVYKTSYEDLDLNYNMKY